MHARHHADHRQHQRQGQQDGDAKPDTLPAQCLGFGLLVRPGPGFDQMRAIACLLDSGDEFGGVELVRQPHPRLFGRQVHGGPVHARHFRQRLLDAADTGRAAHPLYGEVIGPFDAHEP